MCGRRRHGSMDRLVLYHLLCLLASVSAALCAPALSCSTFLQLGEDKGTGTMGRRCVICLADKLWIAFLIGDHSLYLSVTLPPPHALILLYVYTFTMLVNNRENKDKIFFVFIFCFACINGS